ncbi:hypothetical protein [uncultured Jatrophihabitans sp.]|uniref:hypothetical protein n=1 Tax=uncultured Jatrophihabitans sp. TaxID=1610747 RepID=UPI0035CB585F
MAERAPVLRTGPGRLLTFFYGLLAVAATGRSVFQLATMFSRAPTAYLLSTLAAVIYVVAFAAIITGRRGVAIAACTAELIGVVVVGTLSLLVRHDFPDSTVWSDYGSGYGGLPAVLPILALIYLRRSSPERTARVRS